MIVNVLTDDKTTVQVLQSSLPSVIEVVAIGPQGPAGSAGAGDSIDTGSFATTSSLQDLIDVTGSFATTGSNSFVGSQVITGSLTISGSSTFVNIGPTVLSGSVLSTDFISASLFRGDGSGLYNLPANTNWNKDKEYTLRRTEQLTFSGDYILENTNLIIEGDELNSIGEWTTASFNGNSTGTVTPINNNGYLITSPISEGGSFGVQIQRLFDTETTMSIEYVWNGVDVGDDRPYYDVSTYEPTEPNIASRLQNTGSISESGSWTINIPSGSWLAIGVWTDNANETSGSLQLTLPYIINQDTVQYSSNKSFKKEGSIFIGGNLLVKDSIITNNGKINVGGEVILIGNSTITGTGIII